MSYAQFIPEQLGKGGGALLKLLQLLKLVTMETGVGENPSTFQVVHKDNDHSCLKLVTRNAVLPKKVKVGSPLLEEE